MDPEEEANLAPVEVVDLPSVEPAPQEPEANEADDNTDELDKLIGLDPEAPEEPELVEIEIDGKKIKVSQEGKDYLLRQQDYTKKTMDVAEQRKAVEAERSRIEQIRNLSAERFKVVQNIALAQNEIEQIKNIPLEGLSEVDEVRYIQRLQMLEGQIARWENDGNELTRREEQDRSQQFTQAREAALAEAANRVPNFTESRRSELEAFAIEHGSSPEDVQRIVDPYIYEVLHLADIGKKYVERQRKAATIKAAGQAPSAAQVGGKSASKAPEHMSPAEMAKLLGY